MRVTVHHQILNFILSRIITIFLFSIPLPFLSCPFFIYLSSTFHFFPLLFSPLLLSASFLIFSSTHLLMQKSNDFRVKSQGTFDISKKKETNTLCCAHPVPLHHSLCHGKYLKSFAVNIVTSLTSLQ